MTGRWKRRLAGPGWDTRICRYNKASALYQHIPLFPIAFLCFNLCKTEYNILWPILLSNVVLIKDTLPKLFCEKSLFLTLILTADGQKDPKLKGSETPLPALCPQCCARAGVVVALFSPKQSVLLWL
jgi:hypothetical protein